VTEHRPWSEVRAEKVRRDAARGRTPIRSWSARPPDEANDAEYFIHTRGPHEGLRMNPVHVCVPECYEDQSAALERATYVDPRPQYRALATPWYDHDHGDDGHDALACAAGYALEIYVRNPDQLGSLGRWRPLGATQTDSGGTLNLDEVVSMVRDYVETLAYPQCVNVDADQVTVFTEVHRE
jgi:hypothetical protein